jgi:uncharacterized protein (DUF302 family)
MMRTAATRWALTLPAAALFVLALAAVPAAHSAQGGDAALAFVETPVRIARIQVRAGVSFDDAVESLRLRANQHNLKYVGVNKLGKEIEALSGAPSRRIEIYSFCDGLVAQKMIRADASMIAYMPCRIGMLEDDSGAIWLIAMLIDEATLQSLPSPARESARRVTDALQDIMLAAARGDL